MRMPRFFFDIKVGTRLPESAPQGRPRKALAPYVFEKRPSTDAQKAFHPDPKVKTLVGFRV